MIPPLWRSFMSHGHMWWMSHALTGCSVFQCWHWLSCFVVSAFSQCADGKVEALSEALQTTVAKWKGRISMPLPLEPYTSSSFIGLFVEEQVAEMLKSFAADFATEAAAKAGLSHIMNCQMWTYCIYCNHLLYIHCLLMKAENLYN